MDVRLTTENNPLFRQVGRFIFLYHFGRRPKWKDEPQSPSRFCAFLSSSIRSRCKFPLVQARDVSSCPGSRCKFPIILCLSQHGHLHSSSLLGGQTAWTRTELTLFYSSLIKEGKKEREKEGGKEGKEGRKEEREEGRIYIYIYIYYEPPPPFPHIR